jgi:hypothetical protein
VVHITGAEVAIASFLVAFFAGEGESIFAGKQALKINMFLFTGQIL